MNIVLLGLNHKTAPIALRERLPVIPVPVRSPDSDARLDLQAVLDRIYDDAGYGDYIYEENPYPRLDSDDAIWAGQRIGDREVQL